MPYRNDTTAARARVASLERSLALAKAELREHSLARRLPWRPAAGVSLFLLGSFAIAGVGLASTRGVPDAAPWPHDAVSAPAADARGLEVAVAPADAP